MSCGRGNTNHFRAACEATLSANVTPDSSMYQGAPQLGFLLSAADEAGLQIKKLVYGWLGSRCLCQSSHSLERLAAMKRSIRTLRSLHLFLSGSYWNWTGSSSFATFAPKLETLSIRFKEDYPFDPPHLNSFVTDEFKVNFRWSCLASATCAKMYAFPVTLIRFCDRRAVTLKDFSLTDTTLRGGQWDSAFYEMRQRLELKKLSHEGIFNDAQGYYQDFGYEDHPAKLLIERYIVHSDKTPRDLSLERFTAM